MKIISDVNDDYISSKKNLIIVCLYKHRQEGSREAKIALESLQVSSRPLLYYTVHNNIILINIKQYINTYIMIIYYILLSAKRS